MNATERMALLETMRQLLLQTFPSLWAIYAYGSLARGDDHPGSDLDLALLGPPGEALPLTLELSGRLAETAHREVDLVDMRQCGVFLQREVLKDGITVYNAKPGEVLNWEAEAITEYGFHRQRIREILANFDRTGVGYAA